MYNRRLRPALSTVRAFSSEASPTSLGSCEMRKLMYSFPLCIWAEGTPPCLGGATPCTPSAPPSGLLAASEVLAGMPADTSCSEMTALPDTAGESRADDPATPEKREPLVDGALGAEPCGPKSKETLGDGCMLCTLPSPVSTSGRASCTPDSSRDAEASARDSPSSRARMRCASVP